MSTSACRVSFRGVSRDRSGANRRCRHIEFHAPEALVEARHQAFARALELAEGSGPMSYPAFIEMNSSSRKWNDCSIKPAENAPRRTVLRSVVVRQVEVHDPAGRRRNGPSRGLSRCSGGCRSLPQPERHQRQQTPPARPAIDHAVVVTRRRRVVMGSIIPR